MPLVRYLLFAGGILLALLFVADWYLPTPAQQTADGDIDRTIIRIHSDNKWPAAVKFDTTMPIAAAFPANDEVDPVLAPAADKPVPARQAEAVAPPARPQKAPEHSRRRARLPSRVAVRESQRRIATYQLSDGWAWSRW
ncbi:conserved hypothetical protein [Bradyrhizobium sp. STM 3843]|uniref:hypothetical protein n=1 Tax=Bradyrhizobium sp. STM 3843 TaxID=551947 RepID=UPI0002407C7F|nr:hypothetical protein [Bradyrhizobium sp. STM 3843]CCE04898.1 conserved hypothetical protein [Bradyrhizobium sp. STM 3843]